MIWPFKRKPRAPKEDWRRINEPYRYLVGVKHIKDDYWLVQDSVKEIDLISGLIRTVPYRVPFGRVDRAPVVKEMPEWNGHVPREHIPRDVLGSTEDLRGTRYTLPPPLPPEE